MKDTIETATVLITVPAYYSSSDKRVARVTLRRAPWDEKEAAE